MSVFVSVDTFYFHMYVYLRKLIQYISGRFFMKIVFWVWIDAEFIESSTVKEPGSKKAPNPSYGQKVHTGHLCLFSLQFTRNGAFRTYITQRSMFFVYARHSLFTIMNLPGMMSTEHLYSSPGLEEKISREVMDSMLRKMSVIVQLRLHVINTPKCG